MATITANKGNGTSQAQLRDGSQITVKGESESEGEKAFILNREVKGAELDLARFEAVNPATRQPIELQHH